MDRRPLMDRLRELGLRHGLDALIVVAAVSSGVGTLLRTDPYRPDGVLLALEAVAVTLVVALLLLRRRFPFGAPAGVPLSSAALSFLDGRLVTSQPGISLAGMGAAVLLGGLHARLQRIVGLAVLVGCTEVIVHNDPEVEPSNYVALPSLFLLGWLVGLALRERGEETKAAQERAARAEQERELAARIAVAEERARIAREMHDVVAHAMSVMVLQVGAVRHRMPEDSTEDREALESVEKAGRVALDEMRRLLGAMRRNEGTDLLPHAGLDSLESLLADVRAAGLDVHRQVRGRPFPLPPALDLSAYRIVQEGLTNVLKHAHARRAEVTLDYRPHELCVQVVDDGQGPAGSNASGHGLVGVRERVKIYGGDVETGVAPAGGFLLRASLPLDKRLP